MGTLRPWSMAASIPINRKEVINDGRKQRIEGCDVCSQFAVEEQSNRASRVWMIARRSGSGGKHEISPAPNEEEFEAFAGGDRLRLGLG